MYRKRHADSHRFAADALRLLVPEPPLVALFHCSAHRGNAGLGVESPRTQSEELALREMLQNRLDQKKGESDEPGSR
jgi:hypothetical protein